MPSVLIVEDNADVRKYISSILKDTYRIIEAGDGEEGLEKSLRCIPDLIITDIMMPKMDGFQLCGKLKVGLKNKSYTRHHADGESDIEGQDQRIRDGCR